MTGYTFQEGIPTGFTPDFDTGIFHDPRHLQLQSPTGWCTFALLNENQRSIIARIDVHIETSHAASPLRSPFGSFIFSKDLSSELLKEFIISTEHQLKNKKVQTVVLKNPPEVYALSEIGLLEDVLLELDYQIKQEEISAVIHVKNEAFDKIIHRSKKSRLKKGHEQLFDFDQLSINRISEVYDFLKGCREEKGYRLSMSLSALEQAVAAFPENFFLHTVTHQHRLIAACISIQVKQTVLYTFYYDHSVEYDSVSPVVFLCEGLYKFCQLNHFTLLDLGTSHVDGKLVEPLLNFKLSLGATPSRKCTFVKNLT